MGGYDPNPPEDSDAPAKTTLEADQRNTIRNENRKKVGLDYWETTQQTTQPEQDQQQQPKQQQVTRPGFPPGYVGGELLPNGDIRGGHPAESVMEENRKKAGYYTYNAGTFRLMSNIEKGSVENRPDFVPLNQLGNSETQERYNRTANTLGSDEQYALMGDILESQRDAAYLTDDKADDRFFDAAVEQWAQNASEESAAQHHLLLKSDVVGSNSLEFRGDMAVEFLKGSPDKSSEMFSPASGKMSKSLPGGGKGFQEYLWDKAIATDRRLPEPDRLSFASAVDRLGSARGSLFDPSFAAPLAKPTEAIGEANAKRPFVSVNAPIFGQKTPTGNDWNPFIAGAAEPIGLISEGRYPGQPEAKTRGGLPAGVSFTGVFGKVESGDAHHSSEHLRMIDKPGAVSIFNQSCSCRCKFRTYWKC